MIYLVIIFDLPQEVYEFDDFCDLQKWLKIHKYMLDSVNRYKIIKYIEFSYDEIVN